MMKIDSITNRNGSVTYKAFDYYLIDLIRKCEDAVGVVFLSHIEEFGLLHIRMP